MGSVKETTCHLHVEAKKFQSVAGNFQFFLTARQKGEARLSVDHIGVSTE
jgi:hypothetical protein